MKLSNLPIALVVLLFVGCQAPRLAIPPTPQTPFLDHNEVMLDRDMPYRMGGTGKVIVVPAGFVCDKASIPWQVRGFFEKDERAYEYPAMVHDWLYWNQYPRKQADDIFFNAMTECGVPDKHRNKIHWAVKEFGQGPWDENERNYKMGLPRIIPPKHRDTGMWPRGWQSYQKQLFSAGVTNRGEIRQARLW